MNAVFTSSPTGPILHAAGSSCKKALGPAVPASQLINTGPFEKMYRDLFGSTLPVGNMPTASSVCTCASVDTILLDQLDSATKQCAIWLAEALVEQALPAAVQDPRNALFVLNTWCKDADFSAAHPLLLNAAQLVKDNLHACVVSLPSASFKVWALDTLLNSWMQVSEKVQTDQFIAYPQLHQSMLENYPLLDDIADKWLDARQDHLTPDSPFAVARPVTGLHSIDLTLLEDTWSYLSGVKVWREESAAFPPRLLQRNIYDPSTRVSLAPLICDVRVRHYEKLLCIDDKYTLEEILLARAATTPVADFFQTQTTLAEHIAAQRAATLL